MTEPLISTDAQHDIEELKEKIKVFREGHINEERFKAFRLTRGVYGQRQPGVQMFRIKLPYGRVSPTQLKRIAELSEKHSNGNLHITTRQNIQLHYIKLEDTPGMWSRLEEVGVTTRESCGNTVRGITASPFAGIDPNEPFDVTPYAHAVFQYFLRNPICQDMGRKIKIAFSSSNEDSAFTYIHDFGFIPKIKGNQRGFKVIIGGGLGAQAFIGQTAYEFLEEDLVIPFIVAALRVFDRYGERERRHKARLKYLIEPEKGIGVKKFLELIDKEKQALSDNSFPISNEVDLPQLPTFFQTSPKVIKDISEYQKWRDCNVIKQKQDGYFAVKVRIPLGNLRFEQAIAISTIAEKYASDDIRLSINQGLIFKFVREVNLPNIYAELLDIGFSSPGFDTLVDITTCPGTDTCNLGVTNSTALSTVLEELISNEYPHLIDERQIKIKLSGCMNSCGQHMVANIGFSGSSIKYKDRISPAMQVVIGGGVDPDGHGFIAEKVIKIPTKLIPRAVRNLLDDYELNANDHEYFNEYFRRKGKKYFYNLLKRLADLSEQSEDIFQDWGKIENYTPEIGVGECAGVSVDLVSTILTDAKERLEKSKYAFEQQKWAHAIYFSYNAMIIGAKGILLMHEIHCNTHKGIIEDFQQHIVEKQLVDINQPFEKLIYQMNHHAPSETFAFHYLNDAEQLLEKIFVLKKVNSIDTKEEKLVVSSFYNA